MQKSALLEAILLELKNELQMLTDAANTARDEATNEESRAEDRYDMRSQSAAYLAAGQARMAGETEEAIAAYCALSPRDLSSDSPIVVGAHVVLGNSSRKYHYFLGPQRGGLDVEIDGVQVTVVTAASPLGHQLIGRKQGETVLLPGRPKPIVYTVLEVS